MLVVTTEYAELLRAYAKLNAEYNAARERANAIETHAPLQNVREQYCRVLWERIMQIGCRLDEIEQNQ